MARGTLTCTFSVYLLLCGLFTYSSIFFVTVFCKKHENQAPETYRKNSHSSEAAFDEKEVVFSKC